MANRSPWRRSVTRNVVRPIEAVLLYGVHFLLRILPIDAASALGGTVARTLGPHIGLSRRARKSIRSAFPELDDAGVEKIVCEMWDNLGRLVGEVPHVQNLRVFPSDPGNDRIRIEVRGIEHIEVARQQRKPIIFFTGHIGNWEIGPLVAKRYGIPLNVIYRSANNRLADELILRGRRDMAESLVPKGSEGARQLIQLLKEGRALGLLLDQKMNDGIPVPFFGRDAMTAPAAAQLALHHDCLMVGGWVERLDGASFRVHIEPPLELPRTNDRHADIRTIMLEVNRRLESWIRQRPGQWLWLHRRWPD